MRLLQEFGREYRTLLGELDTLHTQVAREAHTQRAAQSAAQSTPRSMAPRAHLGAPRIVALHSTYPPLPTRPRGLVTRVARGTH
jgi:hypothetical protein